MQNVATGVFNLPGIHFSRDEMNDQLRDEMIAWSEETNCGMHMTDRLWSFRNDAHRDLFLLRWAERINENKES